MESSIPWFFWLFPAIFTIHNIEEALWLPAWSKSAGRFHKPVDTFEFVFALIVLTALSVVITVWFYSAGKQSPAAYLYFAFNFGMFVNVFAPHLAATIILKKYCPGLMTGLLLLVPTTFLILRYGYQNEYFLFPTFWFVTIPFFILVVGSIPILFRIGRAVKRTVTVYRKNDQPLKGVRHGKQDITNC
jgi:hypothetical protein